MKTNVCRVLAAITMLLIPAFAAHAGELFSPVLPATGNNQSLECRIINVTNVSQRVIIQAFNSTGAPVTSAYTPTLASGEAWGFAITASAAMYCKFTVRGSTNGFRASIDVLDSSGSIVVALPAQ